MCISCVSALVESRSLVYSISIVLLLRLPLQHKAGMNGGPDIVYSQQNKTPNKTKQDTKQNKTKHTCTCTWDDIHSTWDDINRF